MSIQSELSAELFQELFLNEDLYLIDNEGVVKSENIQIQIIESNNVVDDSAIIPIENQKSKEPEKEIIESQKSEIEPIEIAKVENVVLEKRAIPLLILVNKITEADKVFLEKVLNAIKLSLDKIEIFTAENLKTTDFRSFAADKSFSRIISFGMPFSKIGISKMFVPYQITIIKNIYFLMAEDLTVVENDIAHKRQFWACLQKLFN